jgi:hypothetical protein
MSEQIRIDSGLPEHYRRRQDLLGSVAEGNTDEDGSRQLKTGLSLQRSNIDSMESETTSGNTDRVCHVSQVAKNARTDPESKEMTPNDGNEKDLEKPSDSISMPDQPAAHSLRQTSSEEKGTFTRKTSETDELSSQPTKKIKSVNIKTEHGSNSSPAGKPLLLTKPVEMRSFTGETLELWNSLHLCDGSGFAWSCVGNSMVGKRYRRVCPTKGRMEGFLVAWAKVRLSLLSHVHRAIRHAENNNIF